MDSTNDAVIELVAQEDAFRFNMATHIISYEEHGIRIFPKINPVGNPVSTLRTQEILFVPYTNLAHITFD